MGILDGVLGAVGSASPIGAAVSAIPALFQGISGIFQGGKARRMARDLKRPTLNPQQYNIPPEVAQYLNSTQNRMVNPQLAGQQTIEDKLGANTSNAASDVVQRGGGLNTIADIYGKQMDATAGLGVQAAQNYQEQTAKKEGDVAQALQYSAGQNQYKQGQDLERYMKMFDYNQNQPYQEKSAAISALRDASNRNVYGSLDKLGMIGAASLFKKNQGGNPTGYPQGGVNAAPTPFNFNTGATGANASGLTPAIGQAAQNNMWNWNLQ